MGRMKEHGMDAQREAGLRACAICKVTGPPAMNEDIEWCFDCFLEAAGNAHEAGFKPHEFFDSCPPGLQEFIKYMMGRSGIPLWVVDNKGEEPDAKIEA